LFGKLSGEMTPLKNMNEIGESNVREISCVGGEVDTSDQALHP
jgi:hypothetical protein